MAAGEAANGAAFVPQPILAALLRRLYGIGRRRLLGFAALAAAAAVAEGAGLLLLLPLLHAFGLTEGNAPALVPDLADGLGLALVLPLYVLLVLAAALVVRRRMVAATRLRQHFVDEQRNALYRAILHLDWAAFQSLRSSDLTQALTGDSGRTGLAIDMLASLATALVTMLAALLVAASLSPWLVLAALGLGLLAGLFSRRLAQRSASLGEAQMRAGRETQAALTDTLAGLRLIKGFQVEAARAERFAALLAEQGRLGLVFQADVATRMVLHRALAAAGIALGLGMAVQVFGLAPSAAIVFLLAFARLLQAALNCDQSWRTLMNMLPAFGSIEHLRHWCAAHAEVSGTTQPDDAPAFTQALTLHGVSFRHRGASGLALNDIDLSLPAGSITAIIGPSGAGKSTLADLLLGLIMPQAGRITVDDVALDAANRSAWRARVGYVPQDAFLFHDTIRANLLLAHPTADDTALWRALDQAALGDVVRTLPAGLETVVGDRGGRLSGGERQRLALARALLRQPALLLLDEPTSALDAASQAQILQSLAALRGQLTIVIVTHRMAMLDIADLVVRLEAGRRIA